VSLAGYFAGKTTMHVSEDGYFGNSMLLPNHDLTPRIRRWIQRPYRIHPRSRHISVENVLNQGYQAAFGYFPFARRADGCDGDRGGDPRQP
jgi:hypothetical protein